MVICSRQFGIRSVIRSRNAKCHGLRGRLHAIIKPLDQSIFQYKLSTRSVNKWFLSTTDCTEEEEKDDLRNHWRGVRLQFQISALQRVHIIQGSNCRAGGEVHVRDHQHVMDVSIGSQSSQRYITFRFMTIQVRAKVSGEMLHHE